MPKAASSRSTKAEITATRRSPRRFNITAMPGAKAIRSARGRRQQACRYSLDLRLRKAGGDSATANDEVGWKEDSLTGQLEKLGKLLS